MSWNYLDYDRANHEGHHAVTAAIMQIPLDSVSIDGPIVVAGEDLAGLVRVRQVISRRGLKRGLAAILAPWVAEGRLFPYPPRRDAGGDETSAAMIADVLNLGRGEWDLVVFTTRELLDSPAYRAAVTAVASALLERGTLGGDDVREIVEDETRALLSVRRAGRGL